MARRLKIIVDRDKCVGSGECVFTAPEVFDQDEDDGIVVLLTDTPEEALWDSARQAARQCPANAIRVEEG
ncbi:MAG: ferredoxin [Rhodospirillaceae bacterium]|nr:ferredoxin [Rhodospirillaceae bacterium]MDE0255577.1 ferredoxin [Rhodospirillaceae bacterium]MDE0618238.1 ferredoxin [Rhodospirillaceae bacterium]